MDMPKPDQAVIARRSEIVEALRQIVPGDGVIVDEEALRTFECDGLTAYRQLPLIVVLPENTAQVSGVLAYCLGGRGQGRSSRCRHIVVRWRDAACRWNYTRSFEVQPHPRD